jgi:hypothetical protein
MRLGTIASILVLATCSALACAGGSSRALTRERSPLPRPSGVLIYDFAVDAEDVVIDSFGPNFVRGDGSRAERDSTGRAVAALLSERIVAQLDERGIRARKASASASIPLDAIAVKGQFVSIQEGDQMGRTVIGLGAGSEKLEAQVQIYQMTEDGLRRIGTEAGEAHGRKTPGVAGPAVVGAAAGVAAGVVISSAMNIGSELKGPMKARVNDLAEVFADRAVEFYEQQGWR